MRARWLVPFAVLATSLAPATAYAEPTNREKADALFKDGRTASQAGDYATACAKFADSQALDPSIGTQLNLGDCSEHLGKFVVARAYFRDAIIKLDPSDARVMQARERLKVLEPRMPKLTVTLASSAPAGTVVKCDGRALAEAELGVPVPTDPGEHSCVAVAAGRAESPQTITLKEAGQGTLEVAPGDPLPGPGPGARPTPTILAGGNSKRTIGLIVGGVGVAGLALAGVSGLVLLGEKSAVDSGCQGKTNCNADAQSAISANKTWLPVNTVAWIVGIAGVGVGAFLVLTSGKDGAPAARVGATLLPGGGGASAQVTF